MKNYQIILFLATLIISSCSSGEKGNVKIKNIELWDTVPEEDTAPTPPLPTEPVIVTPPKSKTTQKISTTEHFLIEIRKDESVWYQYQSPTARMAPQKIENPITDNLAKVIADYEKTEAGTEMSYEIRGNTKSTYPVFQKVVNALKKNNIYKYKLISVENEN